MLLLLCVIVYFAYDLDSIYINVGNTANEKAGQLSVRADNSCVDIVDGLSPELDADISR